jgi:hypothetical protein
MRSETNALDRTPVLTTRSWAATLPVLILLVFTATDAKAQQSLACCNCVGDQVSLDLSTGQSSPVDSFWTVNNGPAYTTPPVVSVVSWLTLPPAQWVQPVASPTPSGGIGAGLFSYKILFNVADCIIPRDVRLDGDLAADNNAKVYLDGNLVANCTGTDCFSSTGGHAPTHFGVTSLTSGLHVLQIDVTNYLSKLGSMTYSGLVVNAKVSAQCASCNRCPYLGTFDGANCFIGKPPTGTAAFIFAGNLYYTPVSGNQCPRPGSWFDSANCFVAHVPGQAVPFIFANGWYVQSSCQGQ